MLLLIKEQTSFPIPGCGINNSAVKRRNASAVDVVSVICVAKLRDVITREYQGKILDVFLVINVPFFSNWIEKTVNIVNSTDSLQDGL